MSLLTLTARGDNGIAGKKEGWKLGGVAVLSGRIPIEDDFSKVGALTGLVELDTI
jgi:hypothetical protein